MASLSDLYRLKRDMYVVDTTKFKESAAQGITKVCQSLPQLDNRTALSFYAVKTHLAELIELDIRYLL